MTRAPDCEQAISEYASQHLACVEFGLLELAGLVTGAQTDATEDRETRRVTAACYARGIAERLARPEPTP